MHYHGIKHYVELDDFAFRNNYTILVKISGILLVYDHIQHGYTLIHYTKHANTYCFNTMREPEPVYQTKEEVIKHFTSFL